MARVKAETLEMVREKIADLPGEQLTKCSLCNENLLHTIKTIEVQTGAGIATITNELANRINMGAPTADKIKGAALRSRAIQREKGRRPAREKSICRNPTNKIFDDFDLERKIFESLGCENENSEILIIEGLQRSKNWFDLVKNIEKSVKRIKKEDDVSIVAMAYDLAILANNLSEYGVKQAMEKHKGDSCNRIAFNNAE